MVRQEEVAEECMRIGGGHARAAAEILASIERVVPTCCVFYLACSPRFPQHAAS